jgi:hypothetical protein
MRPRKTIIIAAYITLMGIVGCKPPPGPIIEDLGTRVYSDPAISPDGSQIVFAWNTFDARIAGINIQKEQGLWILDRDSGERKLLVRGDAKFPVFSNDGKRIAFLNGDRVAVVKTNGDSLKVFAPFGLMYKMTWSADDRFLVVSSNVGSSVINSHLLYKVMLESDGEYTRIYGKDSTRCTFPIWHPLSHRIFFDRMIGLGDGWYFGYINADSLNHPDSTNFVIVDRMFYHGGMAITSDNNTIVFDHDYNIWTRSCVNFSDPSHRLHNGEMPSVDSKGKEIVFVYPDPAERKLSVIWIMNIDGSNPRPVTRARDFEKPE